MGLSIRSRRWLQEQAQLRAAQRLAEEQAAEAEAAAYHAQYYDRARAAVFLGISTHKLKRLMAAGKGPQCIKNGTTAQSTVRWSIDDLREFKANPDAYLAGLMRAGNHTP